MVLEGHQYSSVRAAEANSRGSDYRLDGIDIFSEWTGAFLSWAMNRA